MKEQELTALMESAGDRLDPDVETLVAGGAARGRRTLRRRRLAGGVGAFATVAAIAVIAASVAPWPTDSPTVVDDPGFATAPPASDRELAGPDVITERLIDALPAGEVGDVSVTEHDEFPRVATISLSLDDAAVEVDINDTTPEDRPDVPDPGAMPEGCTDGTLDRGGITDAEMQDPSLRACARWHEAKENFACTQDADCWEDINSPHCARPDPYVTCTQLPDGAWVSTNNFRSPGEGVDEPGVMTDEFLTWADIQTPDELWITIRSTQPRSQESDTPLLDFDTLVALVTSDIWFD